MFSLGLLAALASLSSVGLAAVPHRFELSKQEFLLDGKPFQIRSGEMHPARIPAEYWRHRIRMAKAMGMNTIAAYIFWNYQEPQEGSFDFKTGNHDLKRFFQICQEEGMWVLLRPGPYCCGEWDFGGLPPYLLKYSDIKVRCMDSRYIAAASRYLAKLANELKPLQVSKGGPILMLQLENEYGSYGNDRGYISWLHRFWREHGFDIPFYTADGPTDFMLEAGAFPGCAVGLDSGSSLGDWDVARKMNPGVPIFSSETYPGWLTHWGEKMAAASTESIVREVKFLMDNQKSFNLYVIHGGTNFGFTAGANSGGKGYEPDITSYDYDAPVSEQGKATPKYLALRELIGGYLKEKLPDVPAPIPAISIPAITLDPLTSLWDHLSAPVSMPQPKPMEALGQDSGLILYRTNLVGHKSGTLTVRDVHDFALVLVDGKFVGTLDRRAGVSTIELPKTTSKMPVLDILVEAMGRINYGDALIDRKGVTDRVVLNGMTLMDWKAFQLPLDEKWLRTLSQSKQTDLPGGFFKGSFQLEQTGDSYLDLSGYGKGYVWVNGHNLGRFWDLGPQERLYCPASWLNKGTNEVLVLDLLKNAPIPISGYPVMAP